MAAGQRASSDSESGGRESALQVHAALPPQLETKLADYLDSLVSERTKAHRQGNNLIIFLTGVLKLLPLLTAVAAAIWAVVQYTDTEAEKLEQAQRALDLERRKAIATFASDLADPEKRNAASYALAVLSREDAVPLLVFHLEETLGRIRERWRKENYDMNSESPLPPGPDDSFLDALVLSIADIGPPALEAVARLNRLASAAGLPSRSPTLESTSRIIFKILREYSQAGANKMHDVSGVVIHSVRFDHQSIQNLDLSNSILFKIGGCRAGLPHADLTGSRLVSSNFESGDLSSSTLERTGFSDVRLRRANLEFVHASGADFGEEFGSGTDLEHASLRGAVLKDANFQNALIAFADFSDASMSSSNLKQAIAYGSNFEGADLRKAVVVEGDFRNASFKGANLEGAIFISPEQYLERPTEPRYRTAVPDAVIFGRSALIDGADFTGAIGVDERTRAYLCSFGGKNVPGGCGDAGSWAVTFDYNEPGVSSSCF